MQTLIYQKSCNIDIAKDLGERLYYIDIAAYIITVLLIILCLKYIVSLASLRPRVLLVPYYVFIAGYATVLEIE